MLLLLEMSRWDCDCNSVPEKKECRRSPEKPKKRQQAGQETSRPSKLRCKKQQAGLGRCNFYLRGRGLGWGVGWQGLTCFQFFHIFVTFFSLIKGWEWGHDKIRVGRPVHRAVACVNTSTPGSWWCKKQQAGQLAV